MKEEIDEHSFFSESSSSGTIRWQLEPLAINNSLAHSKQTTFSDYHQNGYSSSYQQQEEDESYHQLGLRKDEQQQKVMHRFFDEWPPNNDNDNDDKATTTQLSISIPTCAHDFFLTHK